MSNKRNMPDPATLRHRAEQQVREKYGYKNIPPSEDITPRLLHELQVHQIELEMQNEELRQARAEAETALHHYAELYDFAPTGYLTLNNNDVIGKANLAAARMLKTERAKLIGQRFGTFVAARSQHAFNTFANGMLGGQTKTGCEVELADADGDAVFVLIEAVADKAGDERRLAVIDITRRKEFERDNAEMLRQNRVLARRMFTMQEESLRKISRELHDELGQWLTAIQAEAQAIGNIAETAPTIQAGARAISRNADAMHEVIHRMVHRLRPSLLDALGLEEALRELEKQWRQPRPGIACEFTLPSNLGGLSDNLKITIFRLVQEALSNIASYARASRVSVQLLRVAGETADAGFMSLNIADDGKGFDTAQNTEGTGLLGMRERTIAAGGDFDLRSEPGRGTRISIELPLKNPA